MSTIKLENFLKMTLFYLGFMYIPYEVKTMILCISSVEVSKFEISKKIFLKWLKKLLSRLYVRILRSKKNDFVFFECRGLKLVNIRRSCYFVAG